MSFYAIRQDEMHEFLTSQGFVPMNIPGTIELVYGKVVRHDGHKLSLRVFTAINPTGESRDKGSDAIRVQLYWMFEGKPTPVGKAQKCLRVTSWKKNLKAAIDKHADKENFATCPGCGSPMVLRNGRTGDFWGCSTWIKTKCNGKSNTKIVMPVSSPNSAVYQGQERQEPKSVEETLKTSESISKPVYRQSHSGGSYKIPAHQISGHQLAVEKCYIEQSVNVLMCARAGAGKTTMLRHLAGCRTSGRSMIYLAFGRKNAADGKKKLPREVPCMTTHSFCAKWLRETMSLPEKSDESKTWKIMEDLYPGMKNKDRQRIRKCVFRLSALAKNFACRPGDIAKIQSIMSQYEFELEEKEILLVVELTNDVLIRSVPDRCGKSYDFNDLLWWPVVLELNPPMYGDVLADECQDFNACQIELLYRMQRQGSRIIAVGDPYQAVYRFRGADSDAYDKLKEMLSLTKRGCEELVLPTNYRCGKTIIDYVRETTIVKDIEAAPDAIVGRVIENMEYLQILDMLISEYAAA